MVLSLVEYTHYLAIWNNLSFVCDKGMLCLHLRINTVRFGVYYLGGTGFNSVPF